MRALFLSHRKDSLRFYHIQSAMYWKNVSMLGGAILIAQFGGGPGSVDAGWSDGDPGKPR
jgi:uncharacterized membrane protein YphA (DoxX/SURF4 family)